MRAKRTLAVLTVLAAFAGTLMIASPAAAENEDALSTLPYGKYTGSAIGSKEESKPFAITLYVEPGSDGQVKVTGRTPVLPIPVTITGTPTEVSGGWDIAVSVGINIDNKLMKLQLSGSGVIRLRERDGKTVFFATGSGSKDGNSGSGYASGLREGESSLLDQVGGAFADFLGGPPTNEETADSDDSSGEDGNAEEQVSMPEMWVDPSDVSAAGSTIASVTPPATAAVEETSAAVTESSPTDTEQPTAAPFIDRSPMTYSQAAAILFLLFFFMLLGISL